MSDPFLHQKWNLEDIGLAHLAEPDAGPLDVETLVEALKRCNNLDTESGHALADALLLRFIGNPDVTEAFQALTKWYA